VKPKTICSSGKRRYGVREHAENVAAKLRAKGSVAAGFTTARSAAISTLLPEGVFLHTDPRLCYTNSL
jgi:hypothetical protein